MAPFPEGVGGGGGTALRGSILRERDDIHAGLFIGHADATLAWHLRGVERDIAEDATAATAQYAGTGTGNSLALSWDTGFRYEGVRIPPEDVNTFVLGHLQFPPPVAEVKAFADFQGFRVASKRVGAAGNG